MTDKTTIDLWIAINEIGEWRSSYDGAAEAIEDLKDNDGAEAIRTVKVSVTLSLPVIDEVSVDVPDEAGETVTAEAAE